jgi:hypothetical protein
VEEPDRKSVVQTAQSIYTPIIEENSRILELGNTSRSLKYPNLRDYYGKSQVISTFSHLNANLPIDEVFGNFILKQIAVESSLADDVVLNIAYDNIAPGNDAPKGHKVQFVIVNPDILDPEQVIHLQASLNYDPHAVIKDGQNRIKSVPEQNIDAFRHRFDQVDEIFQAQCGEGKVVDRILCIRSGFLDLTGIDYIPEQSFSGALTKPLADVLEWLYNEGFPFWEMPIPEHQDRYLEHTFLVEGVDENQRRQPARFENGEFVFDFSTVEERRIPQANIFEALRNFEVIPTMPLVILTTATAPQMPHIGGAVWKGYASVHVDAQAKWLGIDETSKTLILSTEGHKPLVTYRQNQEFTGFPAVYLTYGPEMIRRSLEEGLEHKVEFKRVVY